MATPTGAAENYKRILSIWWRLHSITIQQQQVEESRHHLRHIHPSIQSQSKTHPSSPNQRHIHHLLLILTSKVAWRLGQIPPAMGDRWVTSRLSVHRCRDKQPFMLTFPPTVCMSLKLWEKAGVPRENPQREAPGWDSNLNKTT